MSQPVDQPPPAVSMMVSNHGDERRRVGIVERWASTDAHQANLDQVEQPAAQRRIGGLFLRSGAATHRSNAADRPRPSLSLPFGYCLADLALAAVIAKHVFMKQTTNRDMGASCYGCSVEAPY